MSFNFTPNGQILLFIIYSILLAFTAMFGVFLVVYFLMIGVFLVIANELHKFRVVKKIVNLSHRQTIVLIFSIAFLLRATLFFQTQETGPDLHRFVERSQFMMAGQLPYRDFYGGNKPPLYEFMLWIMGLIVGPGVVQFRAVFSFFDAGIAVMLFLMCRLKYDARFSITAALIYALFPIGIITIGLSGHYDSVVVFFTVLSVYLLFRKRPELSGLSLGIAFGLKMYPIVLLPFFLSSIKTWRNRILYTIMFVTPTVIADGLLYCISPSAFYAYLAEQSEWAGQVSIPRTIELMFGATEILSVNITWIVLGIFGLLILWLLFDWLFFQREKILIKWFRIIIILFVIHNGFYVIFGFLYYDFSLLVALLAVSIYFLVAVLLLMKYLHIITPAALDRPESEQLFIVSTFAILLFLFGLPNYAPWYFLWFFPFLLAIKTDKIRYALLWIFPWRGVGRHMRLLPGTPRVN
jgi:hypothetical protein